MKIYTTILILLLAVRAFGFDTSPANTNCVLALDFANIGYTPDGSNITAAIRDASTYGNDGTAVNQPTKVAVGDTSNPPAVLPWDDLLAYYAFEDDVTDELGVYDATAIASPTYTTGFNGVNKSISLNGLTQYATIADNDAFSFTDGAGTDKPYSLSAWVNLNTTATHGVLGKSAGASEWLFVLIGNKVYLINYQNGSIYIGRFTTDVLSTATWYHIAATYDGGEADTGIKIYINGVRKDTTNISAGSYAGMSNTALDVNIGKYAGSELNGEIDEAAIWNRELTAAEVAAIYEHELIYRQ